MAFKKGQSGNPAGRKPGCTPGAQIRKAIEDRKDELLTVVFEQALDGDMTAAKMLLDRITPPLKPVAERLTIPASDGAGLAAQAAAVVNSALSGAISPDVASQLVTALSSLAKITEVDELTRRIEVLEQKNEHQKSN